MVELRTRIFTGVDHDDATAKLLAAMADGSFAVTETANSGPAMWITHMHVIPGAMQKSSYELHITAYVLADVSIAEGT